MSLTALEIPGEVLLAARMTPEELKAELALHLFEQQKLSLGKARELSGMTIWQFMQLLGSRGVSIHYDITEYEQDLETLTRLQEP
ncbi:MAG: UPF0175 family protein [Caldilineales bacterium]|nr:UPF0175 family protein [Caldilineales bacterium]